MPLHDHAIDHPQDAIGIFCSQLAVTRHDKRGVEGAALIVEQYEYLLSCFDVEVACRFIGKYERRLLDEGSGYGHPLLFTA